VMNGTQGSVIKVKWVGGKVVVAVWKERDKSWL
jgi:hypothetical protein